MFNSAKFVSAACVAAIVVFAVYSDKIECSALDTSSSIGREVNEPEPCACMQQLIQQRRVKLQRLRFLKCQQLAEAQRWSPQNWMNPTAFVDCSLLNPDTNKLTDGEGANKTALTSYQPCVCTLRSVEAQRRIQRLDNFRKCEKVRKFVTSRPMNGVFSTMHNCEHHLEPTDVEFLSENEVRLLQHYDPNNALYDQAAKRFSGADMA